MVKVCKFGGTSLADSIAIEKVCKIILSDESRRYVVVSAPGKRNKEDIKITDLLYECASLAKNGKSIKASFDKIRQRFTDLCCELKLKVDIKKYLDEVENNIITSGGDSDYAASRGEYLSGIIVAEKLGYDFVDSAEIIKFNEDGEFDSEYTNDLVSKTLKKSKRAVIPGFYGRMPNEKIKTFSRGGSDVTGSIIARAVESVVYENWTDVSGFLVADPRIIPNAKGISSLSYRELRELSYMGASVLHSEAIFPVRVAGIPINIKNTFSPSDAGTMIMPQDKYVPSGNLITGIAGKKDYTIIYIEKSMMNSELGFARKVLSVLERYGVTFEHMPSGIDTLSLVVPNEALDGKLEKLTERIREAVSPDEILVMQDVALIATVGHGMSRKVGTAAKLCSALAGGNINLKMIDQGSSELNIIVAVNNSDYENAVKCIYNAFFS